MHFFAYTNVDYLPAVAVRYKSVGLCIEFFAKGDDGVMRRHRIRLNKLAARLGSERARMAFAQELAEGINKRLAEGWRPTDGMAGEGGSAEERRTEERVTVRRAVELFWDAKAKEGLRERTLKCYRSFCGKFGRWVVERRMGGEGDCFLFGAGKQMLP